MMPQEGAVSRTKYSVERGRGVFRIAGNLPSIRYLRKLEILTIKLDWKPWYMPSFINYEVFITKGQPDNPGRKDGTASHFRPVRLSRPKENRSLYMYKRQTSSHSLGITHSFGNTHTAQPIMLVHHSGSAFTAQLCHSRKVHRGGW